METPRKRQNKCWCSVPTVRLITEIYQDKSFSFHDADRVNKERKQI